MAEGRPEAKGSRIVQVSAAEAHKKQAMTLGAFVEGLKKEFMGQFGDLSQQLRTMQRGNTYGNDYRINMQQ